MENSFTQCLNQFLVIKLNVFPSYYSTRYLIIFTWYITNSKCLDIRQTINPYLIIVFDLIWLPQDIKILGWYPVGPVLPHGEVISLALVGHPSSDGVLIKMLYVVDVLHRSASAHLVLLGWLKLNLALLLDKLRLA